jgi:hypothetical protein
VYYYDTINMKVFFKTSKTDIYVYISQITHLKSKSELNRENGWREEKIGRRMIEREVFKYE